MAGFSDTFENEILDQVFRNSAAPAVAVPYISLHSGDPGETGIFEIAGGSYIRASGSFDVASGGATANSAQLSWTNMPACTVSGVGIWDASGTGAGNFVAGGLFSVAKIVNGGDTFQIATGDLDITLD